MGIRQAIYDIAVVDHCGSNGAAARMWEQLAATANGLLQRSGANGPTVRVARWTLGPSGLSCPRDAQRGVPQVLALPDSLAGSLSPRHGAGVLIDTLRAFHAGGVTLAAVNNAATMLGAHGFVGSGVAVDQGRDWGCRVEDSGGTVVAHGSEAWLLVALRIIRRALGVALMQELAGRVNIGQWRTARAGLRHFAPDLTHGDAQVLRAQRWLHANQAIGTSLASVADIAGLQPRTLQRRFARATGCSPVEYMQRIRVSHAECLILHGVRLSEVPKRVGYSDYSAFRRIFHRIVGCTPSAYTRRIQMSSTPGSAQSSLSSMLSTRS